jgi:hypothetical protein
MYSRKINNYFFLHQQRLILSHFKNTYRFYYLSGFCVQKKMLILSGICEYVHVANSGGVQCLQERCLFCQGLGCLECSVYRTYLPTCSGCSMGALIPLFWMFLCGDMFCMFLFGAPRSGCSVQRTSSLYSE